MLNTGPYGLAYLNSVGIEYGILHYPRGEGGRRFARFFWEGMAISGTSRKKEEAWLFLDFLTSIDGQKIIGDYQMSLPGLKAAEPFFLNAERGAPPEVGLHKFITAARTYARRQPISLHYGPMSRAMIKAMDALVAENESFRLTPKQTIARYLFESPDLREKLLPQDPAAAEKYRPVWEEMR